MQRNFTEGKNFMKKLLFLIFLLFCVSICHANQQDIIELKYKNKKIGELTVKQFQNLIETSEWAIQIQKAQNNKNTQIKILSITPLTNKDFQIMFQIDWLNDKKEIINHIIAEVVITITPDNNFKYSNFRILYRDIAEITTPILFLLCIIFAII